MKIKNTVENRIRMLLVGVFTMLFAGIIYAWSILKVPFAQVLGYDASTLALNFTLTMCFFCIGGLLSSVMVKKFGTKPVIVFAGVLAGLGFVNTSLLNASASALLYLTYAFMAGLGIGIAYIVIISTVNAWFPDKKGLSSGALMMGFGASSLILGNLASTLFESVLGWRGTYVVLGVAIAIVISISAIFIEKPDSSIVLPTSKKAVSKREESFEARDYTSGEMIKRFTFWRAFLFLVFNTAVGSAVISFARDLAISVGAEVALATTLVGVLAMFNGLGRILTGIVFDKMGRRFTMLAANILTIVAAGMTLLAVSIGSLPLCILGLCLTGMSYGASPTVASAFTSAFYGTKHFASNLGVVNFNLMAASFIATACSSLQVSTGGYVAPFVLLLSLSGVALVLNISVKKP
jgi:OFA family oxalate/formate antiporter-like MFS transporter